MQRTCVVWSSVPPESRRVVPAFRATSTGSPDVPLTSPSRRAAGLLAASTIGLSTAVLSVTGVASATPLPSMHFSTADGATTSGSVPAGICAITWKVIGGQGGADSSGAEGGFAGELKLTTLVQTAQTFTLYPGQAGTAGSTIGGAGGTNGMAHNGTAGDVDSDPAYFGGGGGAASEVWSGGALLFSAYGGDGAGDAGGSGYGNGSNDDQSSSSLGDTYFNDSTDATDGSSHTGAGLISGDGVLCATPDAPDVQANGTRTGDGSITVRFFAPMVVDDNGDALTDGNGIPYQAPDGYEYSTDAGAHWQTLSTTAGTGGDEALYGTIHGLTNGHEYSVLLRTTSIVGDSPASVAVTATPTAPAPVLATATGVTATVGASSIKVSWQAPSDATGISGYQAIASPVGVQSSQGTVVCTPANAGGTSCLLSAVPGLAYDVAVASLDANGEVGGESGWVTSGVVPEPAAPATVPAGSGSMSTPSGAVASTLTTGQTLTLTGDGYAPNSTVDLFIYSTPQKIGTALANGSGSFSVQVTVPASLAPGAHHLVAAGVDSSGNVRYLRTDVTVTTSADQLAWTGFETLPYVLAGIAALAIGGGLVFVARRRRTA
jgi:hypothetical protein